jgi:hypothetical protein
MGKISCRHVWWTSSSNKRWKKLYQKMSLSEHLCRWSTSIVWTTKLWMINLLTKLVENICLILRIGFIFCPLTAANLISLSSKFHSMVEPRPIFDNVTVYVSMRERCYRTILRRYVWSGSAMTGVHYHKRFDEIRTCFVREALTVKGVDMNNSQEQNLS